jgi:SNF2 family DNA or RNA helicase
VSTIPFKHQTEILEESIDKPYWALFLDPGVGKTFISIRTAEKWYNNSAISAVLVLCPKSMIGTWAKIEVPKHSTVDYVCYQWHSSFTKKHQQDLISKVSDRTKLLYFVANHDAVTSDKFRAAFNFVVKNRKYAIVYDESTAIKNPKAVRTQAAIKWSLGAQFKRILSGTPVVQSPLDVFSQTEFLKQNLLGFRSYYGFKARYAEIRRVSFGNRAFDKIVGFRDLDDLKYKLDRFSSFKKLEECMDMPDQVFKKIAVPLTAKQADAYNELLAKAVLYIEEHEITAVNALAMIVRLHQIVVGQLKTPEGTYLSIDNHRLETLEELIEEANHKVIVWSTYVNSTKDIVRRLGGKAVAILSEYSQEKRQVLIDHWRKSEEVKALVLNPASAGHGLTLNEAKTAIFYSNSYNLEYRLQALRRNYRIGQTEKTVVIDLITPGTVEDKIMAALDSKAELAKQLTTKKDILDFIHANLPVLPEDTE